MSHICGRTSSGKENVFNFFNKKSRTTDKTCCSVNCKPVNRYKKDGQNKMKRLKTRKERSQIRGGGKGASKTKSHCFFCHLQRSKDMAHFHNCYHSSCRCRSRREAPYPNVIPITQEPSVITDSRLIGHHGLFNHEVKSVDIERLLSEQGKLKKSEQKTQEKKNHAISHPLSASQNMCADADEVVLFEKKADTAEDKHDDFHKEQKKNGNRSCVTPQQRQKQQLPHSSGSYKSTLSSKHSSPDVVIINSRKANSIKPEKEISQSPLTSYVDKDNVKSTNEKIKTNMTCTTESTPNKQKLPVFQTQAPDLTSSPLQLSSSPTTESFNIQPRGQDPDCIARCVSAMAGRLCDSLQFPFKKKRNLVAESREVLLKALQERHGPRLQENLFKEQRRLSCDTDLPKVVQGQDQKPTTVDEDELLLTDPSEFKASQPCFETQRASSSEMRCRRFNWKPQQSLEQTTEWLTSPVDPSASLLDEILRPSHSPQFYIDLKPSGVSPSDHFFSASPSSRLAGRASASQHWENSFSGSKSKETVIFDSFENRFINQTRAVRQKSCGRQYDERHLKPVFPHQTQESQRYSAEPMHFPQDPEPFQTGSYSFAPSFSAHSHHPNQIKSFQHFSQFSRSSAYTDMARYPPSHMLERSPAPPVSSLLSPEHWSFPPMKLY